MYELSLTGINMDAVHLRSWIELVKSADDQTAERLSRVEELLKRIPPVERDVIELHFFANKSQEQVGEMLGLTQQAVSLRLKRAKERLAFLLDHPRLTADEIKRDFRRLWPKAPVMLPRMLAHYFSSSSQVDTAAYLDVNPRFVRRCLREAEGRLAGQPGETAAMYLRLLVRVRENRAILCDGARQQPELARRRRRQPAASADHGRRQHATGAGAARGL